VLYLSKPKVESSTEIIVDLCEKEHIRVLHVDDEESLLKVAKECLQKEGPFEVETVVSVEEALKKLVKEKFDVVVSDYKMPGKDGLTFLKELRDKNNDIPFIMFTGRGREEVAIKALNYGADQYLNKSGDPEIVYGELAHSICKAVERKRAREMLKESEECYSDLLESISDGVTVLDKEWQHLVVNDAATKILNVPKDRLLATKLTELLRGIERTDFFKVFREVMETRKPCVVAQEFVFPDGRKGWYEVHVYPVKEGILCISTDITERKRTEEALGTSEKKYRELVENLHEGIWAIDKDGYTTFSNHRMAEMLVYTVDEMQGKHLFSFMDQRGVKTCKHLLERCKHGITEQHSFEFIRKDGTLIYTRLETSPITDNHGNHVGALASVMDITEQRQAEDNLRESEEKWRSLVELAPDGIATIDMKGVFTSVNNAFLRLTGYTKEEIVGKHFTKLQTIRAKDIPRYLKLMISALRGKMPEPFEYPYVRKDGTIAWGEAHIGFLKKNGKTIGYQAVFREITERKKAEQAVRESQQKFESMFMSNPEASVYLDTKFHIIEANPRFLKLFGCSIDEIKGKHIDDVVVPENMMEEAKRLDENAVRAYVYHDTVRKRKDGSLVPVSVSAAPLIVEGRLIGYVGLYKDISELKKTEKVLKETLEKLHVVGKLTRHDMGNKLAALTGNVYLARKRSTDDPKLAEYLNEIEETVQQTTRIFDFARDYEMLGMEELTYIDVEKTVNEAAQLLTDLRGIKITNECRGLTVLADHLLRQIFYNLIDNSLKYGGKTSQIKIYYEEKNEYLKLVYADDGVGIPGNTKANLFQEGCGKGTGYGLYLIKRICEVYDWTIQETGTQGAGVQFIMTIPKKNQEGKTLYKLQ
jgi:PAS domain S-box-containing protein